MRCGYCGAKVKYQAHICPACRHLLANDVKLRRIAGRAAALILAGLLLVGVGILIGVALL